MERRLVAILAMDVAGYARLMGADEAGTLRALKSIRSELVAPATARHDGRSIKLMGDGELIEFPSVVEAVCAAVEIQCAMRKHGDGAPGPIQFRIGINIGDVILDGDDIHGDGVNIAARLEGQAEPGGICVPRAVREQVRDKLALDFEEIGEVALKNIARPVRAFRIVLNDKAEAVARAPARMIRGRTRPLRGLAAAVIVLLTAGVGGAWLWQIGGGSEPTAPQAPGTAEPEASLIVLPFDDLSPDGSLGYFADGMTEDITTELARWRELRVVARNSAYTYKGTAVDVRQVAREMGVRYVLEGSLRMSDGKLRINAQLIDGETGEHVWAERFDESGSDVLALQDQITTRLAATLGGSYGAIRADEYRKAWAKSRVALGEYDYYLRGHDLFFHYTPEGVAAARAIWLEGLSKYPDSGLLKIKLGWSYMIEALFGWVEDLDGAMARASALADEGLGDPNLPAAGLRYGLWLRAHADLYWRKDHAAAMRTAKQAVAAFPFDTETLIWMGDMAAYSGELDLASQWIEIGLARSPRPLPNFYGVAGRLRYMQGRYDEALAYLELGFPNWPNLAYRVATNAALGRMDEADRLARQLAEDHPEVTRALVADTEAYRDRAALDRLIADLVKAGWPATGADDLTRQ